MSLLPVIMATKGLIIDIRMGKNGMKKEILYKNLEQYLGRQYKRRIPMLSGTILEPIQRFGPDINMKSLEALLKRRGESFSECLLRMIDKSGRTDADVYNAAHIDRRVFSKIRSSKDYQPKKETAMAFCIGLQLNMDDAKQLLGSAGYAFSNGSRQDLIVQFFIEHKNYDMNELNAALDHFGEKMLTI